MDYSALRKSIFSSKLSVSARCVAFVLIEHLPNCRPSITRIASMSGQSKRSVLRDIAELEVSGFITVTREDGTRSTYKFLHQCQAVTGLSHTGANLSSDRCQSGTTTGANLAPELLKRTPQEKADPPSGGETLRARYFTLEGWVPPDSLREEAIMAGIPGEYFELKLAELQNGPIGGTRGVFDRTSYVRLRFPEWRKWYEAQAGNALSGAATGSRSGFRRSDGGTPPWEVPTSYRRFCEAKGICIETELKEFAKRGYTRDNYPEKELVEVFGRLLQKKARELHGSDRPPDAGPRGDGERPRRPPQPRVR